MSWTTRRMRLEYFCSVQYAFPVLTDLSFEHANLRFLCAVKRPALPAQLALG